MSRTVALVRFADGHIDAAVYTGSSDSLLPHLHDLADAYKLVGTHPRLLPDLARLAATRIFRPTDAGPVEIWTAYGGGMHWFGTASRRRRVVLAGTDPFVGPRTPPLDGTPAWVPPIFRDQIE